jgi:iron complex outermembrane receptor protein
MNGISANLKLPLAEKTHNWVKSVALGYTYLQADEAPNELQSLYVLDYLHHKISANVTHQLGFDNLELNWRVSYQNRNGTYFDWPRQQTVAYQAFWLLDARLSYQFKTVQMYAEASNLFDVDYVDRGNVIQPGLWVSGGLKFDFGLAGNK